MAVGDVWRLKLYGSVNSQQTLNVFHYLQTTNTGTPVDLAQFVGQFRAVVLNKILVVSSSSIGYYRIEFQNLSDIQEYLDSAILPVAVGDVNYPTATPFICWTFRSPRPFSPLRHGYKRFGGVPETLIDNGVAVTGALPDLNNVASALSSILSDQMGSQFIPVIARMSQIAHRYVAAQNWLYAHVGSQNTRKP